VSPLPSPCDGFSGNLPAFVDREVPEAQAAAIETHVDGCAACQRRVRDIEGVSAVLKGWDAQVPAGPPSPGRLRHAVLARVEEQGRTLRIERRARRVTAFALAAAVLVAVGLPLALGLSHERPAAPPPFEALAGAPWTSPSVAEPFEVARLDPARLAHRPWDAAPAPFAGGETDLAAREQFLAGALDLQREVEEEMRFARLTGMRGVWVTDRVTGRRLLLSPEAAAAFEEGELLDYLRAKRDEALYAATVTGSRVTGYSAADLLAPLLPEQDGIDAWRAQQRLIVFRRPGAKVPMLELLRLGAVDAPAAAWPEVLDPLAAQAAGTLRLESSGGDDARLHAVVERTALPVLIPAGTLLAGGADDRVVARDVWLPASPAGRNVIEIAALSVREGARRPEAGVRLTPWMVGPSIRALLARDAGAVVVLERARALRGAALGGRVPLEWSLLDLFDAPTEARMFDDARLQRVLDSAPRGFVALDGAGRFVGLEAPAVGGAGGMALRMRLAHSYEHELRVLSFARGGGGPAGAARAGLADVVTRLLADLEPLVERTVPPTAAVDGVTHAARVPESVESALLSTLRVDGRRVLVSALAR
jgi:hypothetical protein